MATSTATSTAIKAGDIMYSSWGYDQTNIDFYIVRRTTAKSAWIQSIGSKTVAGSDGFMSASVVPDPERVLSDKVSMHRIKVLPFDGIPRLSLTSYSSARPWDGKAKYSSWYA